MPDQRTDKKLQLLIYNAPQLIKDLPNSDLEEIGFMTGIRSISKPQFAPGDLAVDGIFMGIEAGIIMAFFLVLTSLRQGLTPAQLLASFSLRQPPSLVGGLLTHLAVSSIYGILFSLGTLYFRRIQLEVFKWTVWGIAGLAYGFLLWLIADYMVFDNTGILLKTLPPSTLAVAHMIYGLALGLLARSRTRTQNG